MTDRDDQFRVVISIDFGTSRSGYACVYKAARKILLPAKWPGQINSYVKTPTELLYTLDGQVDRWGAEVKARLALLRQSQEARHYTWFGNFKMELFNGHDGTAKRLFRLKNGAELPVQSLIVDYLRKLKDFALEQINSGRTSPLKKEEIRWILTVPAIWRDEQKQIMRTAAIGAGIIGPESSEHDRLLFVFEPEAAAIYCQDTEDLDLSHQPPGTRFMVVDAGGGTVDITVQEIQKNGGLSEVIEGDGGPYGSTYVDAEFKKYLMGKLGAKVLEDFHDEEPIAYLNLLENWETTKCGYNPTTGNGHQSDTYIVFDNKFYKFLERKNKEALKRLAEEQDGEDDCLRLTPETMSNIFEPILQGIESKIGTMMETLGERGCDYILLVGGFSASPLLRRRVEQKFGKKAKVVMPLDPTAAIVAGAASYGLDPSIIRSRRTRLTYGCDARMPFEVGKDPEKKKVWDPYKKAHKCENRFSIFVRAGQSIGVDDKETNTYSPLTPTQKRMKFNFYSTTKKDVRYVDEEGVVKIGEMVVDLPSSDADSERNVEVTMYFGKTEIAVEAKAVSTGKKVNTKLDFSSTYFPELIGQ
jgi:molecular chaperone DnaK (HSP70)